MADQNPGAVKPEVIDMTAIEVFHFKDDHSSFEDFGRENGFRHWLATDLGDFLGYESHQSFRAVVNRAMATCGTLNLPCAENFEVFQKVVDGRTSTDVKMSRFACYLTVMHADMKKPKVVQARAYFAALAESIQQFIENAENIERLELRDKISETERLLAGVAKASGVTVYAFFHNAGYRGMYNMNYSDLKTYKGAKIGSKSLLDFMGREELAANQFRLTQTELKIKTQGIRGQNACEAVAHEVGRTVRNTMVEISKVPPEDLPLKPDIAETKKRIKSSHKEFKKLDKPKS